jgi:dTMP kinase
VGRAIRALVLDPTLTELDARAEALLLVADRAQHIAEVIDPALAGGTWVITDRFVGSTLAYQGYGRGLALEDLEWLSSWATRQRGPDLSVLLDVPPEELARRRRDAPDRLEGEGALFHAKVEAGYRALAQARPETWVVVDGAGTPEEVATRVLEAVVGRLGRPERDGAPAGEGRDPGQLR